MERQDVLKKGDSVSMRGQECVGEIVSITGRYATVIFQSMEVSMPIEKLAKVHLTAKAQRTARTVQPAIRLLNVAADVFSSFNPEIDLHGMSVNSALDTVDRWIDKAVLLGHGQLKIIHGKGTGALRSAVRKYLGSHSQVKRVITKHPCLGGEGVTWLEIL
ncbi:MAG: Smr/MutS family protein [Amoebophilaceae bacterium]|nr:Smr/MutS family protein [Amoebophilaceae bacterium]